MARLISKDVTISVTFLGNQSATAGSYIAPSTYVNNTGATTGGGSGTQYTATTTVACRAKSYSRSTEVGMVESGAMCDIQQFNRPTRVSGTIEMELNLDYNASAAAGLFLGYGDAGEGVPLDEDFVIEGLALGVVDVDPVALGVEHDENGEQEGEGKYKVTHINYYGLADDKVPFIPFSSSARSFSD